MDIKTYMTITLFLSMINSSCRYVYFIYVNGLCESQGSEVLYKRIVLVRYNPFEGDNFN